MQTVEVYAEDIRTGDSISFLGNKAREVLAVDIIHPRNEVRLLLDIDGEEDVVTFARDTYVYKI